MTSLRKEMENDRADEEKSEKEDAGGSLEVTAER